MNVHHAPRIFKNQGKRIFQLWHALHQKLADCITLTRLLHWVVTVSCLDKTMQFQIIPLLTGPEKKCEFVSQVVSGLQR